MNDDVIRCILEHACHKHTRRNVCPIEARLAVGSSKTVTRLDNRLVTGNGIICPKETILFEAVVCTNSGDGVRPIRASTMVKKVDEETKPDDLCIEDRIGSFESADYADNRNLDGMNHRPTAAACLKWGSSKRVSYSIRLSKAISVSVAFDVVSVPTSLWVDDCEGDWWIIQMIDASKPLPDQLELDNYGYVATRGYEVVGYAPEHGGTS